MLQQPSVFSREYVSPNQTITAGGPLTLAHGLGVMPKDIYACLICTTAEAGYSIGDVILANIDVANNRGYFVVPDATNLNIRYGSNANTFAAGNKGTGAAAGLTNANWQFFIKARA